MKEKKSIKISLETTICIFMIILLIVALGVVYYLGFVKNNEKINKLYDIAEINGVISTTVYTERFFYKGKKLVGIRMALRNRIEHYFYYDLE